MTQNNNKKNDNNNNNHNSNNNNNNNKEKKKEKKKRTVPKKDSFHLAPAGFAGVCLRLRTIFASWEEVVSSFTAAKRKAGTENSISMTQIPAGSAGSA